MFKITPRPDSNDEFEDYRWKGYFDGRLFYHSYEFNGLTDELRAYLEGWYRGFSDLLDFIDSIEQQYEDYKNGFEETP